jgi:uncharacterized membrane protein
MAENDTPNKFSLRRPLALSALLVGYIIAVSAWAWAMVPDGAMVPIHWNVAGQVDGYGSKTVALLVVPLISLGLTLLFALIPALEPRRRHLIQSGAPYVALWLGLLGFMAVLNTAIALVAQGYSLDVGAIIVVSVALLFMLIGVVLPGVRSNFFFGVRTPWTLSSERSWRATHRLTGRLFVLSGLGTLLVLLLFGAEAALLMLVVDLTASVIAAVGYSYISWRSDPDKQALGRTG